jgi:hypothetical protein
MLLSGTEFVHVFMFKYLAVSPLVHPALFCINGNSYTISTQSDMYTFIHIYTVYTFFHNTGTLVGQKKWKPWDSCACRVPWKAFCLSFWALVPNICQLWTRGWVIRRAGLDVVEKKKSLAPDGSQAAVSRRPTHKIVTGQFSHNFCGETSAIRCSWFLIYYRRSDISAHIIQAGLVEELRNIQSPHDWWRHTHKTPNQRLLLTFKLIIFMCGA